MFSAIRVRPIPILKYGLAYENGEIQLNPTRFHPYLHDAKKKQYKTKWSRMTVENDLFKKLIPARDYSELLFCDGTRGQNFLFVEKLYTNFSKSTMLARWKDAHHTKLHSFIFIYLDCSSYVFNRFSGFALIRKMKWYGRLSNTKPE